MTEASAVLARVTGLTHRYGELAAIDSIDLEIPAGCMVGFIGPDGVGKSSLLGLLAGIRKIQTGSITLLGDDLRKAHHRRMLCQRIAYMPQGLGRNLYMTLSVFENIDFFGRLFGQSREERERHIRELLDATGLAPFANRPAGKLSGGMKQKLGLCCALIHTPDVLILDEPTTGVDPLSRRQFWEILLKLKTEGVTIIVSTPYMDEVARADRACFVFRGEKLAEGVPADLPRLFEGTLYYFDGPPTMETIDCLNQLEKIRARRFGGGVHVYLERGIALDNVTPALLKAGFDLKNFNPIKPDLEDCFIQLMEES